jgi:pimeloyl-ACP methyl ester carboxylesterase
MPSRNNLVGSSLFSTNSSCSHTNPRPSYIDDYSSCIFNSLSSTSGKCSKTRSSSSKSCISKSCSNKSCSSGSCSNKCQPCDVTNPTPICIPNGPRKIIRVKTAHIIRHTEAGDVRLFFRFRGPVDSELPVILLVHGYGEDYRLWTCLQDQLSIHYPTLAIDLRGFGHSSSSASLPYGYAIWAEDIAYMLQKLRYESAIWIGSALGANIGIYYAAHNLSPKLEKIVVVSANPLIVADPVVWAFPVWTLDQWNNEIVPLIQNEASLRSIFAPLYTDLVYTDFCADCQLQPAKDYVIQNISSRNSAVTLAILNSFVEVPLFTEVDDLTLPVLIVYGSLDRLALPQVAGYLRFHIANANVAEFLGRGAAPNVTAFCQFEIIVQAFIKGLDCDDCDVCPCVKPRHRHNETTGDDSSITEDSDSRSSSTCGDSRSESECSETSCDRSDQDLFTDTDCNDEFSSTGSSDCIFKTESTNSSSCT